MITSAAVRNEVFEMRCNEVKTPNKPLNLFGKIRIVGFICLLVLTFKNS